jgi:hypothetical protein
MAEQAFRTSSDTPMPHFGTQDLLRLAIWGVLAAAALGLAVLSISSGAGSQRMSAASPAAAPAAAQDAAALAAIAGELQRLTEAVQTLAADRDQMRARIVVLEHNLDDVTGALKRDANAAPAAHPEAPGPARSEETPPQGPGAGNPVAGTDTSNPASANPAVAVRSNASAEPPAAGLGVDAGGAASFDGLRTLWSSIKRTVPSLPDELSPVVGVRENSRTHSPDLRLILGPLAAAEAVAKLCSTLAAAHHYCQPVAYEGQHLSLIETTAKAPSTAAVSATSPAPAPAHRSFPGPLRP